MNVIVFGGSGFLGSHVCDKLTDAGYKVTIFDLKKSPYLKQGQKMLVGDIMDEDIVNHAVEGNEVLYNFSGIANIEENTKRPLDSVKVNIIGNSILLDAAYKNKIKRFVFASSTYVLSSSGMFYRSCKRACEDFIDDYNRMFGLDYTILRYGSLYGPRADERNSIYNYIKQALEVRRIVCSGFPDDIREYINVEDAAHSSIEILKPEYANQNIMLTGKESFRVKDLFKMIDEMIGGVEVEYLNNNSLLHYSITPYSFSPKMGKKLVNNPYVDMGQGILHCMDEIYHHITQKKQLKM